MYLDIFILIIMIMAILSGLKNGLFIEFLSIFGLIINFMLAKLLTPEVIKFLNLAKGNNSYILIYIVIFWIIYVVIGMLIYFFINIMEGQKKGVFIRLLGGVLGSIKGFVLAIVCIFIFNFAVERFPSIEKYQKDSYSTKIFLKTIPVIQEYTPKAVKEQLNSLKNGKLVEKYLNKL